MDLRDVIKLRQQHEQQFAQEQVVTNGRIVARNGTAKVPGVLNYVWVSPSLEEEDGDLLAEPVAVYNRTVKVRVGLAVQVGFAPYSSVLEILRTIVDTSSQTEDTRGINLEPHAGSHRVDGDDPLYVEERAFMSLLTYPTGTGMSVHVSGYGYWDEAGNWQVFDGQRDLDLSSHVPGSGSRLVLISLNRSTNSLVITDGDVFVTDTLAVLPDAPSLPAGHVPSAFVYLGATSMVRVLWPHIFNARDFMGRFAAHKLLSSAHSDTVIGDVAAGDLIYGNSTPGWARLPKGTDDQVLTLVSGLPAWADPAGGGGWPFDHELTVDQTNSAAAYPTILDAHTAAAADDVLTLGPASYGEAAVTISKNISIQGRNKRRTLINNPLTVNHSGADISDLYIYVSGSGAFGLKLQSSGGTRNIAAEHRSVADARAVVVEGSVTLRDVFARSDGSTSSYAVEVAATGTALLEFDCYLSSSGAGTNYDLYIQTGGFAILNGCILAQGLIGGDLTNVSGWYRDDNGRITIIGGVWLYRADGIRRQFASFAAAYAAASDGDTIRLFNGTHSFTASQTIAKSITIEGEGLGTILTSSVDSGVAFDVDIADTVTFRNLVVRHTGGGTDSGLFYTDNATIILDNALAEKTSGAPSGTGYGVWLNGGGLIMKNAARVSVTSGATCYGLWNDAGTTAIIIDAGCEVGGTDADIYGAVGASTLSLTGAKLSNDTLTWAGTAQGQYQSTAGDLVVVSTSVIKGDGSNFPTLGTTTLAEKWGHIYLGTSKDIYPFNDGYPLFQRVANAGFTPIEHWSQAADDDGSWTGFAGYTGFSNPPNTVSRSASRIGISHTSGATRYFYYRGGFTSLTNKQIFALCAPRVNAQAGIMIDDGNNNADGLGANNFFRVFLDWTGGVTTYAVLTIERRTGGGAVTTTTFQNLIPSVFYGLGISATGTLYTNWSANAFFFKELPVSVIAAVGSQTWTPARMGLYGRQTSGGSALQGLWDWWTEL